MKAETVRIVGDRQRSYAKQLIDTCPLGYTVKIGAETRRDAQNRLLWSLIEDVRSQCPDMAAFSKEDVKNRFMHALGAEMRFLPELEGSGMFPVGFRSSTLTVAQFSGLCELIQAWGSRNGVTFRDATLSDR